MPDEYLYKVVDALDDVRKETGKTVPQVALNWLLQRPTVSTVIVGARNEEQLRQNLAAAGWSLTPAQVAALDRASEQSQFIRTGINGSSPNATLCRLRRIKPDTATPTEYGGEVISMRSCRLRRPSSQTQLSP